MKKSILKLLCLLVALCMFIIVFSGCSNENDTANQEKKVDNSDEKNMDTSDSQNDIKEIDKSPITLTAIMHPQLCNNKWGEDDVSKAITEKTGVTLDVTYQSTWDDKQLSTLLASGSKLPDFIVCGYGSPVDNVLHSQGYVLPLNELAEEYSPDFFKYLPKDMDKIYAEEDGNLYCVVDLFSDLSRKDELEISTYVDSGLAINKELLEKVGNPTIETLDDFKNACLKVKEANPNMNNVIMSESAGDPTNGRNISQIVNRIYGGQNIISIADDDTVHLNFKDESYLNAIKYIRDLYSSKLIPAESFTMTDEQVKQALINNDVFAYFGFYYNLGSSISAGFTEDTPYWAIDLPTAPGIPRDEIKLDDQYSSLRTAGWHAVHISKDCKNPERAIQYITFMLSDEGQILQRLGVKGRGYEIDSNGEIVFSQLRKDLAKSDYSKLATELGIDNWNWCWFEGFNIIMKGEYLNAKDLPALQDYYTKYSKYASNERINNLTGIIKDEEMQVLRTKIFELWKNSYPKMVLASSVAKLEEEYSIFLEQAEKLGLSKLEEFYTENYKEMKARLEE